MAPETDPSLKRRRTAVPLAAPWNDDDTLYRLNQLPQVLGVSRPTCRRLMASGRLGPVIQISARAIGVRAGGVRAFIRGETVK